MRFSIQLRQKAVGDCGAGGGGGGEEGGGEEEVQGVVVLTPNLSPKIGI